jgi:hypothetical protein
MISLHHFADQILHPRSAPSRGSWTLRKSGLHVPSAQALFRGVVIGSLAAAVVLIWFLQSSAAYVDYGQVPVAWAGTGGSAEFDPFDAAKQAAAIEELPPQF